MQHPDIVRNTNFTWRFSTRLLHPILIMKLIYFNKLFPSRLELQVAARRIYSCHDISHGPEICEALYGDKEASALSRIYRFHGMFDDEASLASARLPSLYLQQKFPGSSFDPFFPSSVSLYIALGLGAREREITSWTGGLEEAAGS